jgi:hypothetical protein
MLRRYNGNDESSPAADEQCDNSKPTPSAAEALRFRLNYGTAEAVP